MSTFRVSLLSDPQPGRCRGCHADIWWVKTIKDKAMCLDRFEPFDLDGAVASVKSDDTHWATCPQRQQFTRA